jgi:prevent-host-death family protein
MVLLCSTVERIGIRELRQHASRYLARVATGETIEVTDRGRAVALLVPTHEDRWQDLVASGQVLAATGIGDVVADAPKDYGIDVSARLAAMRAEER